MKIGVLALQGAFIEHIGLLNRLGVQTFQIRKTSDLQNMDGLILPGGESTAIGKLLHELELFHPLKQQIEQGLPVFGTCAGLILLAKKIDEQQKSHFCVMNIHAKRNAYGRQLASFVTESNFADVGKIPMVFIRGPIIDSANDTVKILSVVNQQIVAAQEKNILATSFHPELTNNTKVHQHFLNMVANK